MKEEIIVQSSLVTALVGSKECVKVENLTSERSLLKLLENFRPLTYDGEKPMLQTIYGEIDENQIKKYYDIDTGILYYLMYLDFIRKDYSWSTLIIESDNVPSLVFYIFNKLKVFLRLKQEIEQNITRS